MLSEGFSALDPSLPLGGPDGGKDALCKKDGQTWIMAVHFPSEKQTFAPIRKKFSDDLRGAVKNKGKGLTFVTNQKLTPGNRSALEKLCHPMALEIYHLERLVAILDRPHMAPVRVRVLHGGGMGKTRLAAEFGDALREIGWESCMISPSGPPLAFQPGANGTLLIIDYPEYHPQAVQNLLQLFKSDSLPTGRWRLLLLSRNTQIEQSIDQTLAHLRGRLSRLARLRVAVGALAAIERAVVIYEDLTRQNRAAYAPDLACSIWQLARLTEDTGAIALLQRAISLIAPSAVPNTVYARWHQGMQNALRLRQQPAKPPAQDDEG